MHMENIYGLIDALASNRILQNSPKILGLRYRQIKTELILFCSIDRMPTACTTVCIFVLCYTAYR